MAEEAPASRWPKFLQPVIARPRLMAGALVGVAVYVFAAPWLVRPVTRGLIAWDSAVIVFLVLTLFFFMSASDQAAMKRNALTHDEGKHFILLIAIGAAIASIGALTAELANAKGQMFERAAIRVALAAGTIFLSWVFVQVIFAQHYAHDYYMLEDGEGHREGLDFPGDEPPDYWDFLHFSVIIGATAQTADITIVSKALRRVSTVHSLIAFAFNTAILALMINLAAGLF
jgi:uncharacterized membrane protein